MQLPEKVTGNFAPEIMLAAAHAQGIKAEKGNGLKDQAGKIFMPKNIMELVTKPGAIIGMLKAIVNALRLRWPAFIGMNVIWSVALFCKSSSIILLSQSAVANYDHSVDVRPVVLLQART
jgi:hypothetical protein